MVTKTKKLHEKLRTYYRGPRTTPPKIINNDEESLIVEALKDYLEDRKKVYKINSQDKTILVRPVFGLDKTLRCFKRKQVRALIYDECTNEHLKGYFRLSSDLPVLEGRISKNIAHKIKLSKLLILSIVEVCSDELETGIVTESEIFNKFWLIFHSPREKSPIFNLPILEQVRSSGKSQAKKVLKRSKRNEQKQAVVVAATKTEAIT